MSNLVLAYLGDAVYELYIREHLINQGFSKVNELQTESIKYVSAVSQRKILEHLETKGIFNEEEMIIINRGRNANSHKSKSTDIITYKKATGLECLIGFLYLNDRQRLEIIMKEIIGAV
jgi:ribonuclease-3 family protein